MLDTKQIAAAVLGTSLVLGATVAFFGGREKRIHDPYPWRVLDDIWTEDMLQQLLSKAKSYPIIPSAVDDITATYEHIGEWVPLNEKGECTHPLLTISKNRTGCCLPQRFDVAYNYLATGGFRGLKETTPNLISRMLSFIRIIFDELEHPAVKQLFESDQYAEAASAICGADRPLRDKFQLAIIFQLAGQQVPAHLDSPYFWGANRHTHPQWLLVVMKASGMFDKYVLPQAQGVAYIHSWEATPDMGGEFYFYPKGRDADVELVPPKRNTGLVVDGTAVVHGTNMFKLGSPPPANLKKDDLRELVPEGDDVWLRINGEKISKHDMANDLRLTLVWREKCFKDQAEKDEYDNMELLELDFIFDELEKDLKARGKMSGSWRDMDRVDWANFLVRQYILTSYPKPRNAWIGLNYCGLEAIGKGKWWAPAASGFTKLFC